MALRLASSRKLSNNKVRDSYLELWNFISGRAASVRPIQCNRRVKTRNASLHTSQRLCRAASTSSLVDKFLSNYKSTLSLLPATQEIRDLEDNFIDGTEVVLHGYLGNRSDLSKKLSFLSLISRDLQHSVQLVSNLQTDNSAGADSAITSHLALKRHGAGTPVVIRGILKARPPSPDTSKSTIQDVHRIQNCEVLLKGIEILNTMPKDIPITAEAVYPPEQRHLLMRQSRSIRDALLFRSKVARACRLFLEDQFGFSEIETPLLFKSTPEGAREFLVPSRRGGGFAYALPQSPQQFKQVLMGSGISRYYQFARCFRDEDLRADRQPEFTQLDMEMSFAGGEEVLEIVTALIKSLWKAFLQVELPETFQRITYKDAMTEYGIDKPDLRFDMKLSRIDYLLPTDLIAKISPLAMPAVDAMVLRFDVPTLPSESLKFISRYFDSSEAAQYHSNPSGAPGIFVIDHGKPLTGLQPLGWEAAEVLKEMFRLEDGDVLIMQARPDEPYTGGSIPIGNLRLSLHREAVAHGLLRQPSGFAPLWVTDFPLFTPISMNKGKNMQLNTGEPGQGGLAGLSSTHHPFTSPKSASDVDLLLKDPVSVIGEHYDLVMNGVELGGGSRRIHNEEVQRFVMERVLRMPKNRVAEFDHLLEVLRTGCPPHAGIALGFDRLVSTMLGSASIRDVIAFPKSGTGEDLLMKSPGLAASERLAEYHLQKIK